MGLGLSPPTILFEIVTRPDSVESHGLGRVDLDLAMAELGVESDFLNLIPNNVKIIIDNSPAHDRSAKL